MKTILSTLVAIFLMANSGTTQENNEQHQHQQKQKSALTDADQLQIAVQKICPVMGAELGSMGEPIKVKAGEQVVFLCCNVGKLS